MLTPKEREVLKLLYEGQTEETIAMMTGVTTGTIGNLKTRILTKFRDFFAVNNPPKEI